MRCLIVEDNDFSREALRLFLADQGEIEQAVNGREAVQVFQQALDQGAPFDLVMLDIVMPEMDGQQALKLIRQAERDKGPGGHKAVIIMTTALNSAENIEEALWEGDCTDYLVKPIARADLMAMLCRYGLSN